MAGHSHDDHHAVEKKPVAFTVPFILALVTIIITLLFLSLCDPKPHGAHHGEENAAHAKFEGTVHNPNAAEGEEPSKGDQATATTQDTNHVDHAEPAHAEAHGAEHH
jgi:hypothetical protein